VKRDSDVQEEAITSNAIRVVIRMKLLKKPAKVAKQESFNLLTDKRIV